MIKFFEVLIVYAQSGIITANLETYDPRQLKLFCWIGEPEELPDHGEDPY